MGQIFRFLGCLTILGWMLKIKDVLMATGSFLSSKIEGTCSVVQLGYLWIRLFFQNLNICFFFEWVQSFGDILALLLKHDFLGSLLKALGFY